MVVVKQFGFKVLIPILFFLILIFPCNADDFSFGGEISPSLFATFSEEAGVIIKPLINMDLELFLPYMGNNEIRCAINLHNNIYNDKLDFYWKKLYWKHRWENLQISAGIQPISWSFGSLLNPMDFTLGAAALNNENEQKYQKALEIYYPINWNTSLTLVTSMPGPSLPYKIGFRGRTLINDFDITAINIIEGTEIGQVDRYRFGTTVKGDLGPIGVYGALGNYSEEKSLSFLIGFDYSYLFPAGNQLSFQAEYINCPTGILNKIIGYTLFPLPAAIEKNMAILAGNISYRIDEFSNISLATLYQHDNNRAIFIPVYSNQLSTNSTIQIKGGIITEPFSDSGRRQDLKRPINNKPINIFLEIDFGYTF